MTQVELVSVAGLGLRFIRALENDKPTLRMNKVNQVLWQLDQRLEPVAYETFESNADLN